VVLATLLSQNSAVLEEQTPWSCKSPLSKKHFCATAPLSQNSAVLAAPLSPFTLSFNQKAIQIVLKLTFSQKTV